MHPLSSPIAAACFVLLIPVTGLSAQNRAHPGLVPIGDGEWGTRDQAVARGLVEYRGRWLAKNVARKLPKWEKLDRKTESFDDAYRTNSEHYRITTNLPRFIVELEIKPFLDALYKTYVDVFKNDFGLTGRGANKKFIKIYATFAEYSKHEGRTRGVPGFIRNGNELVVYYDETDPARFYGTTFHEGAHQFFKAMLPGANVPHWLNEALATYFEGCVYSRVTNEITVEYFPPDRLQIAQGELRRASGQGPGALFRDPRSEFGAKQYALAWSWVYTVTHVHDGKHRKGFGKLLRDLNGAGTRSFDELFEKNVGIEIGEIDALWREFVLGLSAGDPPQWVMLSVTGGGADGADLRSGDMVWSVAGIEIYSPRQFRDVWKEARDSGRPVEVVVVRRTPPDFATYEATYVRETLGPDSGLRLSATASVSRPHNLID